MARDPNSQKGFEIGYKCTHDVNEVPNLHHDVNFVDIGLGTDERLHDFQVTLERSADEGRVPILLIPVHVPMESPSGSDGVVRPVYAVLILLMPDLWHQFREG